MGLLQISRSCNVLRAELCKNQEYYNHKEQYRLFVYLVFYPTGEFFNSPETSPFTGEGLQI